MKLSILEQKHNKNITVLCGISGSGKTHARTVGKYKGIPSVDVADIRKEHRDIDKSDWMSFHMILINKIKEMLKVHDHIVVEGYFLPGTPSRSKFESELKDFANINFVDFKTDLKTCLERLKNDFEEGKISEEEYKSRSNLAIKVCMKKFR